MTGIVILNGASNYDERGASFFFLFDERGASDASSLWL